MNILNQNLLLSFGFTLLIVISARVSIPMEPVPLTMQTAAIFLAALLLPMKYAVFSVVLYISLGALGLPVFSAGRSGVEVLTGPTAGFIVGFAVITVLISFFTRNIRYKSGELSTPQIALKIIWPCLIGTLLLQVLGILWGKHYTGLPWSTMLDQWLHPFYINMIFKIAIAVLITVPVWKNFSRE